MYQHAETRLEESPIIGELSIKMLRISLNSLDFDRYLYASGGARVEGAELTATLIEASGFERWRASHTLSLLTMAPTRLMGKLSIRSFLLVVPGWVKRLKPLVSK